jgi:hypothetical protein
VNTRGLILELGKQSIFRPQFLKVKVDLRDTSIDMPNQLNQREAIQHYSGIGIADLKLPHMISLWRSQFNFYQANSSIYSWVTVEILSEMGIDLCSKVMVQVRILILS